MNPPPIMPWAMGFWNRVWAANCGSRWTGLWSPTMDANLVTVAWVTIKDLRVWKRMGFILGSNVNNDLNE